MMPNHRYRLSDDVTVVFGDIEGSVEIHVTRAADRRRLESGRIVLTADEWTNLVDRSPYMPQLAERYPVP